MVAPSLIRHKHPSKHLFSPAFTLVELLIVIAIIGVVGTLGIIGFNGVQKDARDKARDSQTTIIANALEKYYDDNNEYPSVALMTSQNVDLIKQKLKITDSTILKFPTASTASSIISYPVGGLSSPAQLAYSANTSDSTKNDQCLNTLNGYCDGFVLQYKKEFDGTTVVANSLHNTFTPVAGTSTCAAGETQSGNTCTKTYAATSQPGTYSCLSGGTLNNTTCTQTYPATYSSGGTYYTCSTGTVNGSNCDTTSTYTATQTQTCPSGYPFSTSGDTCYKLAYATGSNPNVCWPGEAMGSYNPTTNQTPCKYYAYKQTETTCPNGGTLSGTTCTVTSTSPATSYTYSGGYYCSGSGSLDTSTNTCTNTYTATQGASYYTCPSGGAPSGSTCTYTYTLP